MGCLLLLLGSFVCAQSSNTSLSGVVKDPVGSVIPNATVILTNAATSASRSQKTGSEGRYSFDLLTPGEYSLEVLATGFRKQTLQSIHVLIAQANTLEVIMQVGAMTEEVTVNAESNQVMVDTQDASLGNNFISQQITQLPLEARNVLSLLTLQPGVTKDGYVAGGRADQSNVTLDGVDINEAYSNAIGPAQTDNTVPNAEKGPVLRLNSEAIEEFRVSTLNSGAGGGRSSGAQIALVTKSGSNTWHGAAFESNRNTIFTANDWFNNHAGVARPTLIRNTFGGAVGGPVIRDKVFFFYSYEGRTDASQTPVLAANVIPRSPTQHGSRHSEVPSMRGRSVQQPRFDRAARRKHVEYHFPRYPGLEPGRPPDTGGRRVKVPGERYHHRRRNEHGRIPVQRQHARSPALPFGQD